MAEAPDLTEARRTLGRQLAANRGAAGLTQEQFARQVHYGRGTIANVETGRQTCSRTFWERADTALGAGGKLLRAYEELQALARDVREDHARHLEAERATVFRQL